MSIKKTYVLLLLIASLLIMNLNSTAEQISFAPYDYVVWFLDEDNGKLGLKDMEGNVIIHPSFDGASPFINNLAVIENDQLYGVIDKTGKVILPICFQQIDMIESNIIAGNDGFFQLYSQNGVLLSDEEFEYYDKINGYYIISTGGVSGIIDSMGKTILNQEWLRIRNISENGWIDVADDEAMFNYLNINGTLMFPEMIEYVTAFSGGYGGILQFQNDNVCFVNEEGVIVRETDFYKVDDTKIPGLFKAYGDGVQGIYNPQDDCFINIPADRFFAVSEEAYIVEINKKWGVMDKHCSLFIPNIYMNIEYINDGIFAAQKDTGLIILLDQQGKQISNLEFQAVYRFSEGLLGCIDQESNLLGFVDAGGNWVIAPEFHSEYFTMFKNGVCDIHGKDRVYYIDNQGRIISYSSNND